MRCRFSNTLVLMMVAAVGACGDKEQSLPSAPDYHTIASSSSGCDFTHINQLVNSYFTTPRKQAVRDIVSAMDAAADFSSIAQGYGFDIMANVDAEVSKNTAGDPNVGSNLVNHVILCMYQPGDSAFPVTFPVDFTIPLTFSLHGQFHVKPSSDGDAAVVLSRDTLAPFSGVAPFSDGVLSGTWASVLVNRTDRPDRVLLYGRPGPGSPAATTYDWKTVPHNAAFDSVVVAVCVNQATETTSLINEENVGLLPFVDAPFLVPGTGPGTCSSTAMLDSEGPAWLAHRLVRMGASLFGPQALWAAALSPGGLGGSSGGIRSEFGPAEIDSVHLEFKQQPTSTKVNAPITPPVTILATAFLTAGGTKTLPNVSITIGATNNNGTPAILNGTKTQVTDGTGIATYSDLSETKSGGYKLVVITAGVGGRGDIPVGSAASAKFNISPK
jgi:hypothetical protein